eukprot:m.57868 g.57868  ORF g.57868 m.57868 type:complete len:53 (-) comp17144_c0_seq2:212-370(-)
MGYAKKRGDLREHLGFKAIARYHAYITDPTNREHRASASHRASCARLSMYMY